MKLIVENTQKHPVEKVSKKQNATKQVCNYADNYYGDQNCTPKADSK